MTKDNGPKGLPLRTKNLVPKGDTYYFRMMKDGKRYERSTEVAVRGRAEFEAAKLIAHQWELDIIKGKWGLCENKEEAKRSITLGEWCDKYLDGLTGVVEKTRINIRINVGHLRSTLVDGKTWEERDLRSIMQSDCKQMISALQRSTLKAQNSLRTFHSIASTVFAAAIADRYLETNPWSFKRLKTVPRERVVLKAEENAVRPHLEYPYYQRVMTMGVWVGLRAECELAALQEADVDFERKRVFVRKGKGGKQRYVPLPKAAVTALRDQIAANKTGDPGSGRCTWRMQQRIEKGYVFPVSSRAVLNAWERACEKAGIELFTSHDLRRTYGTRAALDNVPMHVLKEWMGHEDIRVTEQHYSHVNEEAHWLAVARFEKAEEEAEKRLATGMVIPFEKLSNTE